MFTWESSPACKKAIEYFEVVGVTPKIVRLDDPWSEVCSLPPQTRLCLPDG